MYWDITYISFGTLIDTNMKKQRHLTRLSISSSTQYRSHVLYFTFFSSFPI